VHAVILAGGLGTRLGSLVREVPKPMLDVNGRPFLEYLIAQLRSQGYRRVVICTGHLGDMVRAHFGSGDSWRIAIDYSQESQPLGTAGALKLAEPLLEGDRWLVMNGDSFFDVSLTRLVDAHLAAAAMATMALASESERARYGGVALASGTEVAAFVEKDAGEHVSDAGSGGALFINAGIYVIERPVLQLIAAGRQVSLERDVFPRLVGRGLHGLPLDGAFTDIGVPEAYLRLREAPEPLVRLLG
jgi:mannose-1-phosphate guanylyltransferase